MTESLSLKHKTFLWPNRGQRVAIPTDRNQRGHCLLAYKSVSTLSLSYRSVAGAVVSGRGKGRVKTGGGVTGRLGVQTYVLRE